MSSQTENTLLEIMHSMKEMIRRMRMLEKQEGLQTIVPWTDYSNISTIVGWTSFTTKKILYCRFGIIVLIVFQLEGTSNSLTTSFTLPYSKNADPANLSGALGLTEDNGVVLTTPGRWNLTTNVISCFTNMASAIWTASGLKWIRGELFYIAA